MVQTVDILFLSLSVGFLVLIYYLVVLIKRFMITLDRVDIVLEDIKDTTGGVRNLKNQMTSTFFSTASMVLGMIFGKRR